MVKYDLEKQQFLVEKFHQTQSCALVKRAWRTKFKNTPAPRSENILCTFSRFQKTGSVLPISNKPREITQKRKNAKISVETLVSQFPRLSLKLISSSSQISRSMARKVLKEDLARNHIKFQNTMN